MATPPRSTLDEHLRRLSTMHGTPAALPRPLTRSPTSPETLRMMTEMGMRDMRERVETATLRAEEGNLRTATESLRIERERTPVRNLNVQVRNAEELTAHLRADWVRIEASLMRASRRSRRPGTLVPQPLGDVVNFTTHVGFNNVPGSEYFKETTAPCMLRCRPRALALDDFTDRGIREPSDAATPEIYRARALDVG